MNVGDIFEIQQSTTSVCYKVDISYNDGGDLNDEDGWKALTDNLKKVFILDMKSSSGTFTVNKIEA